MSEVDVAALRRLDAADLTPGEAYLEVVSWFDHNGFRLGGKLAALSVEERTKQLEDEALRLRAALERTGRVEKAARLVVSDRDIDLIRGGPELRAALEAESDG